MTQQYQTKITFAGKNGDVILKSDCVIINRRSNTLGTYLGQRVIPLEDIESVFLYEPKGAYLGVLRVILKGSPASRRGGFRGRIDDVNSDLGVTFKTGAKRLAAARDMATAIEEATESRSYGPACDLAQHLRGIRTAHQRGDISDSAFLGLLDRDLPRLLDEVEAAHRDR